MSLRSYLAAKAVPLCIGGICALYLFLTVYFCGLPASLLAVLLLSALAGAALCLVTGWYRTDRRLRTLKNRLDSLPERYLIGETVERPRDAVALEYYLLMKEVSRAAVGAVAQARAEKRDYCDFVERWVHEIKTPLTVCSLILANGGDPAKLRRELRRADNLTETILTYAKLPTAENDTQISHAALRGLCDQAIREEMELLIAADIAVSIDGQAEAYTDPKLLVFMLKQLLINCAKYCPGCRIGIALAPGSLTLTDNGRGIPAHELPRLTERGFTGEAGRETGSSTGMGLYLVGELCKKLSIVLAITSETGRFTRFSFSFPA